MKDHDFAPNFAAIPDPASEGYDQAVAAWLAGTYDTGWSTLKDASCSSAMTALKATIDTYNLCTAIKAKESHPGIRSFVLDSNYSASMLGPCLGTVILASFALESFVRLGFSLGLEVETRRPRSERAGGIDRVMQQRLADFDAEHTLGRLRSMWRHVRVPLHTDFLKRVTNLAAFRNSLAHDAPGIVRENVRIEVPNKKKGAVPRADRFGPFIAITTTERPVRLRHVIEAIQVHDLVVTHSLKSSRLKGWAEAVASVDVTARGAQINALIPGAKWWPKLREVSRMWEDGPQKQMQATAEEHFDGRAVILRRLQVKLQD